MNTKRRCKMSLTKRAIFVDDYALFDAIIKDLKEKGEWTSCNKLKK